jgi:tetratricopeptide (TPR) repeat protein
MEPEKLLPHDARFRNLKGPPLRGVFLNYLLDCLPAAVLEIEGEQVNELHVRTVVARNVDLADHTDMTAAQLRQRANRTDAEARRDLLEVYGLFASEYEYQKADLQSMPYGEFALNLARGKTKYLLHSYGAIECLEKLMKLVHPSGFILLNDYGSETLRMDHPFEHQRFGLSTFVGVNFAELRECFGPPPQFPYSVWWEEMLDGDKAADAGRARRFCWIEPEGGAQSIHSRLLAHRENRQTIVRFLDLFGGAEQYRLQEPLLKARTWARHGRSELAADEYRQAIKLQPYNWVILSEMAGFLIFQLRGDQHKEVQAGTRLGPQILDQYGGVRAGIDLAKLALAQNPTCSAELWNILGDGLFVFGRDAEAASAYRQALAVNGNDVRARYNLAFVHCRQRNFAAAFKMIAEGLALDKMRQYRDGLLKKLQEALDGQTQRDQQEYLMLINLVSRSAPGSDKPGLEAGRNGDGSPRSA